jgi:flagellar biosynthesis protein FliP
MKPRIYVAIGLMITSLVAGLIMILGLSSNTLLPIYMMLFLMAYSAMIVFMMRDSLGQNMFAACIILVILAISATFFLMNLKTYHQILNDYGNPDTSAELSLMQTENTYYTAYAEYLFQRVLEYQNQSIIISNNLAELEKLRLEKAQQASIAPNASDNSSQISIPENYYITYYPEGYGEGNDG